jgi:hypothetical protein
VSNKKKAVEMWGETHLPADLFTPTDAYNGMLDTFPDLGRGLGVLDAETLGLPRNPTNIPTGETIASDFQYGEMGLDSDFFKEASLADLSWLEVDPEDVKAVPVSPVDRGIPELEEAWGVNRRTDGLRIIPAVDRERAQYEASLKAPVKQKSAAQRVRLELQRASRLLAAGAPFKRVAADSAARLGADAPEARSAISSLKEEQGLLGVVYVKASDYPGCDKGQWTDLVRKKSASAAFVVKKADCEGCVHAQEGKCSLFKKTLVSDVPWKQAVRIYSPRLEATGRHIASGGDPKEALRAALASTPVTMPEAGTMLPVVPHAADQISTVAARQALAATPAFQAKILQLDWNQVYAHLERWQKLGHLTQKQAAALRTGKGSPREVLYQAAQQVAAVAKGAYSGGTNAGRMGFAADEQTVARQLIAAEEALRRQNQNISANLASKAFAASPEGRRLAAVEAKCQQVVAQIELGLRGRALVAHILRAFEEGDRGLAGEILDPIIKAKNALREPSHKASAYSGIQNNNQVTASDAEAAWAHLRAVHPPSPLDLSARREAKVRAATEGTLNRWARDGLLSEQNRQRLLQSSAPAQEVLRIAAALIGRAKVSSYSGIFNRMRIPDVSPDTAWKMLAEAENGMRDATDRIQTHMLSQHEAEIYQKAARVEQAIHKGVRGSPLVALIRRMVAKEDIPLLSRILDPLIKKTGALKDTPAEARKYAGVPFTQHTGTAIAVQKHARDSEIGQMIRTARQQMSEGMAGKALTDFLRGRFARNVLSAGKERILMVRKAHEGLSGHIYVDAAAYASGSGLEGCEKGAARHRTNRIPAVLGISKCGSCIHKKATEDGTPVCSLYRKALVGSAPVDDPQAYQRENIRLANGDDTVKTAALFANTYDPDEFNLGGAGSELDNITFEDPPEEETTPDIIMDGMYI